MTRLKLPLLVLFVSLPQYASFLTFPGTQGGAIRTFLHASEPGTPNAEEDVPKTDDIPTEFHRLLLSAENATQLRPRETADGAHDPFRYEWGSWVVDTNLEYLMQQMGTVRINEGVYQKITGNRHGRRLKVASGDQWDCYLHCLPKDQSWQGQWPTGSWTMIKTLIGVAEISALRGPDRDGLYHQKTVKELRGGSDGSFAGGNSFGGADAIKYLGGALRRYSGKAGKTVIMEVVIRPPIKYVNKEVVEQLDDLAATFTIVEPEPEPEEEDEEIVEEKVVPASESQGHLGKSMGMTFDKVGGLDKQLDSIARRVLASRANPEAARRLGVSHVRGILLSGPPGCGKTLLARELAHLLGARAPQIVNGPEILDKFIGEAEKKVRDLFLPAEQEYREVGDASALHIIILDEMDAIARKRGTMSSDTTGVRDSVVNQLLAKMDGVKEANNVLVVGLTNRPELLDPALLRPGRLEVQLRVELPDLAGRRDILRIHTRRMIEAGALDKEAVDFADDLGEQGLPARTDHFTGAELAGLVRSAASFALARTVDDDKDGVVAVDDLESALKEVIPALGKQDETLKMRFPFGISSCSPATNRVIRDLTRFVVPIRSETSRLQSLLLVGAGGNGGAGATALGSWAAAQASSNGAADYVRFVTALDLLGEGSGGDAARASALIDKFVEAKELQRSLLVLDDVDHLCAGNGPHGYSTVMIAALRALLRSPPSSQQAGRQSQPTGNDGYGKTLQVIATTSRSDAACVVLHELFDETVGKSSLEYTKLYIGAHFLTVHAFFVLI